MHVQLPTLAFPSLKGERRSEEHHFVQVGLLNLAPATQSSQLITGVLNRTYDFDLSLQNVPSTNAVSCKCSWIDSMLASGQRLPSLLCVKYTQNLGTVRLSLHSANAVNLLGRWLAELSRATT